MFELGHIVLDSFFYLLFDLGIDLTLSGKLDGVNAPLRSAVGAADAVFERGGDVGDQCLIICRHIGFFERTVPKHRIAGFPIQRAFVPATV